jgi:hypothetical protein
MNKDNKSRSKSTTRKTKAKEVKARGPTGWNLYLAEHRQAVKDKEECTDREAMKMIGEMWNELSESERKAYNEKAEEQTQEMIKNGEVDPELAKSKKKKSPSKSKSKAKDKDKDKDKSKKSEKDKKKKDEKEDEEEDDEDDKKKNKKDTKGKKPESNKNKKSDKNKKKKNAEEDDEDDEE